MSKNKWGVFAKYGNASYMNDRTFWEYFDQLKEYAINMFEWTNLPDTIDERYLELQLFDQGFCCFFKADITRDGSDGLKSDENDPYLALQCTLSGRFNVYNLPTSYRMVTPNGFRAERNKSNAVIIYNNYLHKPTLNTIYMYAYRLYLIQRTIDINVKNLRHPMVMLVPENQRLSFKNMWNQVDNNEDMIFGDSNLDLNQYQALQTGVKNDTIDLQSLKHQVMNEALTFLGINNANTDKKERLLTGEIESNNDQLFTARQVMLNARQKACDEINKMFGLNIGVRYRTTENDLDKTNNETPIQDETKLSETGIKNNETRGEE